MGQPVGPVPVGVDLLDRFQQDAATGPQVLTRLRNPPEEARIVRESVFEPVVIRVKTDEEAGLP